jgi:hypothetical protein
MAAAKARLTKRSLMSRCLRLLAGDEIGVEELSAIRARA